MIKGDKLSTRWNGDKQIDWVVISKQIPGLRVEALKEKLSDHKRLSWRVDGYRQEEYKMVFEQKREHRRPDHFLDKSDLRRENHTVHC